MSAVSMYGRIGSGFCRSLSALAVLYAINSKAKLCTCFWQVEMAHKAKQT